MMNTLNRAFTALWLASKREEGQTFVEYALIGLLVALVVAVTLGTFAGDIGAALGKVGAKLNPAS